MSSALDLQFHKGILMFLAQAFIYGLRKWFLLETPLPWHVTIYFQDMGESKTNDTQQEIAMDTGEPTVADKESNRQTDENPTESVASEPMDVAPAPSSTETPVQEIQTREGDQSDAQGLRYFNLYGPLCCFGSFQSRFGCCGLWNVLQSRLSGIGSRYRIDFSGAVG